MLKIEPDTYKTIAVVLELLLFALTILLLYYLHEYYTWREKRRNEKKETMKLKYRDHRGSLSESMETVQEFDTVEQIVIHLNKFYNHFNAEVVEIKFVKSVYDDRINWDTYNVTYRLKNETAFCVAGMSDGKFDDWKLK
jgi:hypothetical protein